jgi:hypothetical protein
LPVLFEDDYSATTVFEAGEDESGAITIDGRYRHRFKRDLDIYTGVPDGAPERSKVQQAQNVSVAVEAEMPGRMCASSKES